MLIRYIQSALKYAEYKKLDDGTWFAEIPGFEGVWANAHTVEACRTELEEVLGEWLILNEKASRDKLRGMGEGLDDRPRPAGIVPLFSERQHPQSD